MQRIKLLSVIFLLSISAGVSAQNWLNDQARTDLSVDLQPFYHGVASGDPLQTQVIIWTRVTPDSSITTVSVDWRVATDTNMTNIVASGTMSTTDSVDFTVKVDVTGLSANTWYYYEFTALGRSSLIGRTKTAQTGDNPQVRFAVVSCSSFESGYFNAYARITARNDIEAVLHLGDYIYEYEAGGYSGNITGRDVEPTNEIVTLADYRTRMSHHHLDHDLRRLHQSYPFINVWDDHETANNSWQGGAGNHDPGTEGPWADRKSAAIQAYFEWLPLRKPDPGDDERIYRKFSYGDLVDLYMLDTRIHGRDEQVGTTSPSLQDSSRSILGPQQYNWLVGKMDSSTAQWQILGQQVMVTRLEAFGTPVNDDQWDGYPIERQILFNDIDNKNINNVVVLTGDIHTSWANDLPFHPSVTYVPSTGAGSMGVEFVTPSITSPGSPGGITPALVMSQNPHIKYVDLTQNGYYVLDITKTRAQADFYYVPTIATVDITEAYAESWYANDLDGFVQGTNTPSVSSLPLEALPPLLPKNALAPIAVDDVASTDSGIVVIVDVQANDYDPNGDPITTAVISGPANGTATVITGNSISYAPGAGFIGTDVFTYTACDNGTPSLCDTAQVTITVNPTGTAGPLPPVALDDAVQTDSATSITIDVQGNDFDPNGDPMTTSIISGPGNGTATINGTSIDYLPATGFVGTDAITYSVCDNGTPSLCGTAVVNINVISVTVGLQNLQGPEAVLFGVYPNPVDDLLLTKFYLYKKNQVTLRVIDISGKEVATEKLGTLSAGLFYADIDLASLAAGTYILVLQTNSGAFKRKIVKN
ncbi:MAG: alkaline phosphatase D family protein [Flavobacteriales bacterium]|nr:alkaline phosphatase D family protein [Flavobacteriales bacterium]